MATKKSAKKSAKKSTAKKPAAKKAAAKKATRSPAERAAALKVAEAKWAHAPKAAKAGGTPAQKQAIRVADTAKVLGISQAKVKEMDEKDKKAGRRPTSLLGYALARAPEHTKKLNVALMERI